MTIRTRMTFWYVGILMLSILLIAGLSFTKLREHRHESEEENDWEDVIDLALWIGIPGAVLGVAGGWWLMRKALAPVSTLTQAIENTNDGTLRKQLPRSGNGDELDRLTEVFNDMTARLDGSFVRIREFTLHASHELKTPLTVLHGEIESSLRDENLSNAHRERLASQLDEIQRLTKIVDGLTLLTKADAGQVVLNYEAVVFDEVVRDVFADAQILAKPANITVTLENCEPVTLRGDKHRLRQLLLNLADNAVKYNQPGGRVGFSLARSGADAELKISNTGKGIAPEILERVFERFFRGDPAHNSAIDGCGLGLSIAQWIVAAHGGSIRIESKPDKDSLVTVVLPLVNGAP